MANTWGQGHRPGEGFEELIEGKVEDFLSKYGAALTTNNAPVSEFYAPGVILWYNGLHMDVDLYVMKLRQIGLEHANSENYIYMPISKNKFNVSIRGDFVNGKCIHRLMRLIDAWNTGEYKVIDEYTAYY